MTWADANQDLLKNAPLSCTINNGQLSITMGTNTLMTMLKEKTSVLDFYAILNEGEMLNDVAEKLVLGGAVDNLSLLEDAIASAVDWTCEDEVGVMPYDEGATPHG